MPCFVEMSLQIRVMLWVPPGSEFPGGFLWNLHSREAVPKEASIEKENQNCCGV